MDIKLSQAEKQAKKIARTLKGGEILGLSGDLGSGKTTFTKALGKELGVRELITSPTFVLMQHYKTKLKGNSLKPIWLYHLDLYRTKNFSEIKDIGLTEIWGRPEVITVIEWSDKISSYLPKNTLKILFTRDDEKLSKN